MSETTKRASIAEAEPLAVRIAIAYFLITHFDRGFAVESKLLDEIDLAPLEAEKRAQLREKIGEMLPQGGNWTRHLLKELLDIIMLQKELKLDDAEAFASKVLPGIIEQDDLSESERIQLLLKKGAFLVRRYRFAARNATRNVDKKKRKDIQKRLGIGSNIHLDRIGDIKRELFKIYPNAKALKIILEPWGITDQILEETVDLILATEPSLSKELIRKLSPGDSLPVRSRKELDREHQEFQHYLNAVVESIRLILQDEPELSEIERGMKAASDMAYHAFSEKRRTKKKSKKSVGDEPAVNQT